MRQFVYNPCVRLHHHVIVIFIHVNLDPCRFFQLLRGGDDHLFDDLAAGAQADMDHLLAYGDGAVFQLLQICVETIFSGRIHGVQSFPHVILKFLKMLPDLAPKFLFRLLIAFVIPSGIPFLTAFLKGPFPFPVRLPCGILQDLLCLSSGLLQDPGLFLLPASRTLAPVIAVSFFRNLRKPLHVFLVGRHGGGRLL